MARIRIALIGCGHMAGLHAPHLKLQEEVELVACCDVSVELAQRWLHTHWSDQSHRPEVFSDRAVMYERVKPDAVIIATPHTSHFKHAVEALDAGCHVLLEKPMVTSAQDGRILGEKVKASGKVFVIGYNTPCTPQFHYIREVIRNGTFGRLEMISGYLAQNWLRYTNGTWRQDPKLSGGGQVYDSGAHLINSMCWSVESEVSEVFAWVDRKGLQVDVNSCAQVRFANSVLASLIISGNCPVDHGSLSFFFDNGKIDVDGWYSKWIRCWQGQTEVQPVFKTTETTPVDNFINSIRGREEVRTKPMNGIIHSQIVDAMYESARTGLPVRLARGNVVA